LLRQRLGLDHEQGVELFYNIAVTPWLHVTPDLQFIDEARNKAPLIGANRKAIDTAVVAGLRVKIDFWAWSNGVDLGSSQHTPGRTKQVASVDHESFNILEVFGSYCTVGFIAVQLGYGDMAMFLLSKREIAKKAR
jgi:Carbohydrate-selective porin, OprB family